jgi:hypothetical protein
MNQTDQWKQLIAAIQQIAAEKEQKNFVPSSQSEFWKQMADAIREKQEENHRRSNPFGKSLTHQLVEGMRQKLEEDNKNKLNLFEASLNKTTNLICKLFQEIDVYVLADEINANMNVINEILDELSPELKKRNELIELIKGLRAK